MKSAASASLISQSVIKTLLALTIRNAQTRLRTPSE